MNKLVRARHKELKYMADKFCCPEQAANMAKFAGREMQIILGTEFSADMECQFCGFEFKNFRYVEAVGCKPVAFAYIDIDEGAMETA